MQQQLQEEQEVLFPDGTDSVVFVGSPVAATGDGGGGGAYAHGPGNPGGCGGGTSQPGGGPGGTATQGYAGSSSVRNKDPEVAAAAWVLLAAE